MTFLNPNSLFQELLIYRDRINDRTRLGPWLQEHMATGVFSNLEDIPLAAQSYVRCRIAQEDRSKSKGQAISQSRHLPSCNNRSQDTDAQFEALILRWDRQAKTRIHGHPDFCFYHVITGVFEMELFEYTVNHGLQFVGSQLFFPSQSIWSVGTAGQHDNFIHRVTCLEPGLTFHIYSDDAQKGIGFEAAPSQSLETVSQSVETVSHL